MVHCLYIHIPFCLKKCIYCDFYSIPAGAPLISKYVEALCKEIEMIKDRLGALGTVYIGGGTPSVLSGNDITKIMTGIRRSCVIDADAEITSEANPCTLTDDGVKAMADAGINRISMGVQSLCDRELELLGRMHDAAEAIKAFHAARRGGFRNISTDLIYGIPGQGLKSWEKTLEGVVSLRPEHISTYELTPEQNTLLYDRIMSGELTLPDEDEISRMYYGAIDKLKDSGYAHYEISNFALPGHECRHNLNYWNRGEYLGIGAGAHSFFGGRRTANVSDAGLYIEDIEKDRVPVSEEITLSAEDVLKETLFLGLRKVEGLDLMQIPAGALEKMKEALRALSQQGLVETSGNRLKLARKGLLLSNEVIVRLMLCIEDSRHA